MEAPIYHLQLSMRGARVQTFANGLPLGEQDARSGAAFSTPINVHLVGEANEVRIVALPTLKPDGTLTTPDDVAIEGSIKKYGADEIAGPETGEQVARIDFAAVISERQRQQAERLRGVAGLSADEIESRLRVTLPLETTVRFDNEGPSFRGRLLEAEVITDEVRLLEYAELLRYLMERREAERLYAEFKPKLDDYNAAYPADAADDAEAFPAFLRDQLFPSGPITTFSRDEVRLRAWCDGRIWEPYIAPDQPFFTTAGLNGYAMAIRVFIGIDGGKPRVVR